MVLRLIRSTDWGALLELVSPRFFDVLEPRALRSEITGLVSGFRDRKRYATIIDDRAHALQALGVDIVDGLSGGDEADPDTYGQRLLELYFWQLFARDTCLLDLRSTRLRGGKERLRWHPSRIYVEWDERFIAGIRGLYGCFYDGDDTGFHEALAGLELSDAAPIFIQHFGGGDQRAVRFELESFQRVFARVFAKTQDAGKRLHPNFVSLGVYLGSLYENLSRFDRAYDVRAAVERARSAELRRDAPGEHALNQL